MIQAVLFDLGNTLFTYLDFSPQANLSRLAQAMDKLFPLMRQAGVALNGHSPEGLTRQVLESIMGVELRSRVDHSEYDVTALIFENLQKILPDMSPEWGETIDRLCYDVMDSEFALRADALETLDALKARGLATGLISNTQFRKANMDFSLRRFGLAERLDPIVYSIDAKIRKPHPDIFIQTARRMGRTPEEIVFVGDTVECDVAGARACGMKSLLIRTPDNGPAIDSGQHGADEVIESLSEIPSLIDGLRD